MWVQLLLIVISLLFCINMSYKYGAENVGARHKYVTLLVVLLVLQSALRHLSVGPDTYSFYVQWNTLAVEPWRNIFYNFYEVYVLGIGKDAGFLLLFKLLNIILGGSFFLFLVVYGIAFFLPLERLIEKHVPTMWGIFMAFCLYQVLFYSFFSITGMRQGIATIATFYCVRLAKEKKIVRYLLLLLLASFIHKSVLLFIPFYFLYHFKNLKVLILSVLAIYPIVFLEAHALTNFMIGIAGTEQYGGYGSMEYEQGGAVNFTIIIAFITILTIVAKIQDPEGMPDFVVNSVAVAFMLTPLTWVDSSLMRIVQYYSIFSMIALPLSIDRLKMPDQNKNILFWALWVVLMIVVIRHDYQYFFFWQDVPIIGGGN